MKFNILLVLLYPILLLVQNGYAQDGKCPELWASFKGNCYKAIPPKSQTFDEAQAQCVALKANLVSVHSWEEHNFLIELAKTVTPINYGYWTGMKFERFSKSDAFIMNASWVDGSVVDYGNPASPWPLFTGPDNSGYTDCVVLHSPPKFHYKDMPCNKLDLNAGMVCRLPAAVSQKGLRLKCPGNAWKSFNSSCFIAIPPQQNRDFEAAQLQCQFIYSGSNLASIHSHEEYMFVRDLINTNNAASTAHLYWIGLQLKRQNRGNWVMKQSWIDGTPFDYGLPERAPHQMSPWFPGDSDYGNETCTRFLGSNTGFAWAGHPCERSDNLVKGAVCKGDLNADGRCEVEEDENWQLTLPKLKFMKYKNKCYWAFLDANNLFQPKAQKLCAESGGNLASIHSWEEHKLIRSLLYKMTHNKDDQFWHGFRTRRYEKNNNWITSSYWEDGSAVVYPGADTSTPWAPGHPDNCCGASNKVDCVKMWAPAHYNFQKNGCDYKGHDLGAFCKRAGPATTTTTTTTVAPPPPMVETEDHQIFLIPTEDLRKV